MGTFLAHFGGLWATIDGGFRGSKAHLDKIVNKGGSYNSDVPLGQTNKKKILRDPKIGRKDAKERDKRLCEEKIVKTSKTSTLSSEKRGWSGREGPKILKNRPRSGLEGLKSSIVT